MFEPTAFLQHVTGQVSPVGMLRSFLVPVCPSIDQISLFRLVTETNKRKLKCYDDKILINGTQDTGTTESVPLPLQFRPNS
jgi:hypothetical protein